MRLAVLDVQEKSRSIHGGFDKVLCSTTVYERRWQLPIANMGAYFRIRGRWEEGDGLNRKALVIRFRVYYAGWLSRVVLRWAGTGELQYLGAWKGGR